jgi:hypothetical protein
LLLTEVGSQNYEPTAHHLQKLEVNEQAGTLQILGNVGAPPGSNNYILNYERALHIGEQVYYYSNGAFNYANW